jgi:hypothetical protein
VSQSFGNFIWHLNRDLHDKNVAYARLVWQCASWVGSPGAGAP